jgi:hypothetical protein
MLNFRRRMLRTCHNREFHAAARACAPATAAIPNEKWARQLLTGPRGAPTNCPRQRQLPAQAWHVPAPRCIPFQTMPKPAQNSVKTASWRKTELIFELRPWSYAIQEVLAPSPAAASCSKFVFLRLHCRTIRAPGSGVASHGLPACRPPPTPCNPVQLGACRPVGVRKRVQDLEFICLPS